jgi:L-ribulokinase
MNSGFACEYRPKADNVALYEDIYAKYVKLGRFTEFDL